MLITRDQILFTVFFVFAFARMIRNVREHLDLSYKITPYLSINKNIELPLVSICLPEFIDEIKFAKIYPEKALELDDLSQLRIRKIRRKFYDQLTLKQLAEVSYSVEDFLESCVIFDNNMNLVNCTDLSPMVEWISFEDKCFQFFSKRNQSQKQFVYNRDQLVNHEWLTIIIKKNYVRSSDIGFLVSAPSEILQPFSYNTGYILISSTYISTLFVIINKFRISRLPAPFSSDCYNYTGQIKTQIQCVVECFYHKYKPIGLYPDQLLTDNPENLYGLHLDKENRTTCIKRCEKRDCLLDKFDLKMSYKKMDRKRPKLKLVIRNSFSEERELVYESSVRNRNILSTVSFILSPLAFFCGISLFTIHLYIVNLVIYMMAIFVKMKQLYFKFKN